MCGITLLNVNSDEEHSISHRGPDSTQELIIDNYRFIFHRLSINGIKNGNQPFQFKGIILMCNGEIYNYKELISKYNLECQTDSDCEVILHLYIKFKFKKMLELLIGEYSIILYNSNIKTLYIARDTFGVRPLFENLKTYEYSSEAKTFKADKYVKQFDTGTFKKINFMGIIEQEYINCKNTLYPIIYGINDQGYLQIKSEFIKAVARRITNSERPIGFLLSGGFDSSIVVCIARHLFPEMQIETFSIGQEDSTDLKYAKEISNYVKSKHHEIIFTSEEAIKYISDVIYAIESYDITTIRASIPMYLLCKYISENTQIKVLLSGEGSDEYGSYKYFYNAPSTEEATKESKRLFQDINYFDGLRADRCVSHFGLELRLPFLDTEFYKVMRSISPEFHRPAKISKDNEQIIEKRHLRATFEGLIPQSVQWRIKDAFSDSVGYSWRLKLIEYAESQGKNEKDLYYEIYSKWYHPNLIPYYWMPKWSNATDPSAKVL